MVTELLIGFTGHCLEANLQSHYSIDGIVADRCNSSMASFPVKGAGVTVS